MRISQLIFRKCSSKDEVSRLNDHNICLIRRFLMRCLKKFIWGSIIFWPLLQKLKSSFKPSRHWGPRDPITHHYWLASRDEGGQSAPPMRYTHRQFGQFLGNSNFADVSCSNNIKEVSVVKNKGRSNSDDWIFVCRKQDVAKICKEKYECRKRSKSLDWAMPLREKLRKKYVKKKNGKFVKKLPSDSIHSFTQEKNNNIFDVKNDLVWFVQIRLCMKCAYEV